MPDTTIELYNNPMSYEGTCVECGKKTVIVLTIRDWTRNGYPVSHQLCTLCAIKLKEKLCQLLNEKADGLSNGCAMPAEPDQREADICPDCGAELLRGDCPICDLRPEDDFEDDSELR